MAGLGKITNSILSGSNENNLSLASLKFDFSLLKFEAPAEFAPLGSALTARRRLEAEEGSQHQTSRRLAALFEQLIPPTPNLVSAYGSRVSEIISKPNINPVGLNSHGPFRDFIGADGTAIWAAATSGIPALGIYLLACLLARAWGPKESTSIWVELVAERKTEIKDSFRSNHPISDAGLVSVLQDIPRHDLALWDASARSWLRSADQAKQREHDQLSIILKNINVPFPGGSSTYQKVISTWNQAMTGIEDLLCGRPQSISHAGVLLALSSWHLYPDLIVLGDKTVNVKFKDPLRPSASTCTVGIQLMNTQGDGGVRWSLALSHLRYYGDPMSVTSTADGSRVSISQLCLVAFGGILRHWRVNLRDFGAAAEWFCCIWKVLKGANQQQSTTLPISRQFAWLQVLVQAARMFTSPNSASKEENLKLINYGYRRSSNFICNGGILTPFFGLRNPYVLSGLCETSDPECGFAYLRGIAKSLGLASGDCIIVRGHWEYQSADSELPDYYEYATAVPHDKVSHKRNLNGQQKHRGAGHARWYYISPDTGERMEEGQLIEESMRLRISEVSEKGNEQCFVIPNGPNFPGRHRSRSLLWWNNPPGLFYPQHLIQPSCGNHSDTNARHPLPSASNCRCFDPTLSENGSDTRTTFSCCFEILVGSWGFGLGVKKKDDQNDLISRCKPLAEKSAAECISPSASIQKLIQSLVSKERLLNYLCLIAIRSEGIARLAEVLSIARNQVHGVNLLTRPCSFPNPCYRSLHALYSATLIYRDLHGATIPLSLILAKLGDALWIPEFSTDLPDYKHDGGNPCQASSSSSLLCSPALRPRTMQLPTRPQAFACITHLDTGEINLEPGDFASTLAISSQNSIFVAGVVLSDPLEPIEAYDVRRLVGNIGKSGVSLLIVPQNPKIRQLQNDYTLVNHAPYDLKREDNFSLTSLHLSFTNWSLAVNTEGDRTIDQEVHLVEAVISVRDRGVWVADLDILGIQRDKLVKLSTDLGCPGSHEDESEYDYTSIDSWEEFLDYRNSVAVGVFRAHGNWAARLAAVSILSQSNDDYCTGIFDKRKFCLKCLEGRFQVSGNELDKFESHLPSICID